MEQAKNEGNSLHKLADQLLQVRSRVRSMSNSMESPSVELGECSEHPDHQLQYWRQDDQQWVCQYCLIFGAHKAHTALTQRAGQIIGSSSAH